MNNFILCNKRVTNRLFELTYKLDIAFKVTPKVKNKAQVMAMGLTFVLVLKAMFN